MKFDIHQPPREFSPAPGLKLKDMGDLHLDVDEQVTVRLAPDRGNDVVRKPWGFYLTNSLNGTLQAQGIKTALVENRGSLTAWSAPIASHRRANGWSPAPESAMKPPSGPASLVSKPFAS